MIEDENLKQSKLSYRRRNRSKLLSLDMKLLNHKNEAEFNILETEDNFNEKTLFEVKLNTDTNIFSTNINSTISTTIDSLSTIELNNKETENNVFKKKSNFCKKDIDEDQTLNSLYKERGEVIVKNLRDIEELNEKYSNLTITAFKEESDKFCKLFRKKRDENMMLENHLKDEINLLNNKKRHLDDNFVNISEHKQVIDDMNFNFEIKKRILSEKIKYFSTLLNESNNRQSISEISNYDNTIFNFTASSLIDKSVFLNTQNEFSQCQRKISENVFMNAYNELSQNERKFTENEDFNIYCSTVMKENNVIGNIGCFQPKFFKK